MSTMVAATVITAEAKAGVPSTTVSFGSSFWQ